MHSLKFGVMRNVHVSLRSCQRKLKQKSAGIK